MTDPDLFDRQVLDTIYALAIKHRMSELSHSDSGDDRDDEPEIAPSAKLAKGRQEQGAQPAAAP